MNIITVKIPCGFKVRTKLDAKRFAYELISNGEFHIPVNRELAYIIERENNTVRVYERCGDLHDIFNPNLEVACTGKDYLGKKPEDYVWFLRKYINRKYFN